MGNENNRGKPSGGRREGFNWTPGQTQNRGGNNGGYGGGRSNYYNQQQHYQNGHGHGQGQGRRDFKNQGQRRSGNARRGYLSVPKWYQVAVANADGGRITYSCSDLMALKKSPLAQGLPPTPHLLPPMHKVPVDFQNRGRDGSHGRGRGQRQHTTDDIWDMDFVQTGKDLTLGGFEIAGRNGGGGGGAGGGGEFMDFEEQKRQFEEERRMMRQRGAGGAARGAGSGSGSGSGGGGGGGAGAGGGGGLLGDLGGGSNASFERQKREFEEERRRMRKEREQKDGNGSLSAGIRGLLSSDGRQGNENRSENLASRAEDAPQAVSVAEIEAQMIRAQKASKPAANVEVAKVSESAGQAADGSVEKNTSEDDQYERLLAEQRAREKAEQERRQELAKQQQLWGQHVQSFPPGTRAPMYPAYPQMHYAQQAAMGQHQDLELQV
eukprot:g3171.t1